MNQTRGKDGRTFGQRLRALRDYRSMTQAELAEAVGIKPPYLSDLELGRRGIPTAHLLEKFADALNVTVDELLGREASGEIKLYLSRAEWPPEARQTMEDFEQWLFAKYGIEGDSE